MSASPEHQELNRLSCTRCRDRKIRCNRVQPTCGRCRAGNLTCAYPARQKRRMNKVIVERPLVSTSNEALHGILDRLRRLEAHSTSSVISSENGGSNGQSFTTNGGGSPASANGNGNGGGFAVSPVVSLLGESPVATTPHSGSASNHHTNATSSSAGGQGLRANNKFDVNKVMHDATNRVQELRLQSFGSSAITEPIDIPKDLAKSYVSRYFARRPEYSWSNVVDKELLELLPDIIGRRHVHVDPVMVVIYYCILYQEAALNACRARHEFKPPESGNLNQCYLGCLRALPGWQREASGSLADFVAALFFTRISAECFDFDMSWRMFKLACEYCQTLNLHNIDKLPSGLMTDDMTGEMREQRRKDIWEIIQIDHFFRLTHDMPPALTDNPWNVNLPWLAGGGSGMNGDGDGMPDVGESMVFVMCSKITLIMARFFAMMDEAEGKGRGELRVGVEGLCQEIIAIYDEYPIDKLLSRSCYDEPATWTRADVALMGYTVIMHMLRKVDTLDMRNSSAMSTDEVFPPYSHVIVGAARNVIMCLSRILAVFPVVETMTCLFGAYRCYLAFSVVAVNILDAPYPLEHAADVKLLQDFADQAEMLSRGCRDIMPLTSGMQLVNSEIRARIQEYSVG